MNQEQFKQRRAELLTQEYAEPERWMYLSFADETFHGAVVIKAHGLTDAITRTHALNINPGGQVFGVDMPDDILASVPETNRQRLLSAEEIKAMWPDAKSIREHEEDEA